MKTPTKYNRRILTLRPNIMTDIKTMHEPTIGHQLIRLEDYANALGYDTTNISIGDFISLNSKIRFLLNEHLPKQS